MEILSDRIQDLENKNKALIIENNRYKNLDLTEINILMERLKEARKAPKKVWKSINEIFGKEFLKFFFMQEMGNFHNQIEYIIKEFKSLEEKTGKKIKEIENLIMIKNDYSLCDANVDKNDGKLNKESDIEKLEKNILILNSIIEQKNFVVESLQEETCKEKMLSKKLHNDIFNLLIERFKCNYLIKFHNGSCALLNKIAQNFKDSSVQSNEADLYNYLISNSFLKDISTNTNEMENELNQSNIKFGSNTDNKDGQEAESSNNIVEKKKRKNASKNKYFSIHSKDNLDRRRNHYVQRGNTMNQNISEKNNKMGFESLEIRRNKEGKLDSIGNLKLNVADFSKIIDSNAEFSFLFDNTNLKSYNQPGSSTDLKKKKRDINGGKFLNYEKSSYLLEENRINKKNNFKKRNFPIKLNENLTGTYSLPNNVKNMNEISLLVDKNRSFSKTKVHRNTNLILNEFGDKFIKDQNNFIRSSDSSLTIKKGKKILNILTNQKKI